MPCPEESTAGPATSILPIPRKTPAGSTGEITRRTVLRGAALGMAAMASGVDPLFAATESKPPNIVFIMADDLGYADVACYGRPDLHTPNIDALAAKGVRFLQAYANSAVCSATRTALITGRYQDRLSVGLDEPLAGRDIGLPPDVPTLPSLLKKAGYSTTLIGKWHLGLLPKYGPLQSGYDHFYGFRPGSSDYYAHPGLYDDDVRIDQAGYLTEVLGNHAVNVVNGYARSGKPFLLSLHFNAPHWPWEPPGDDSESKRLAGRRLDDFDGGTQQVYPEDDRSPRPPGGTMAGHRRSTPTGLAENNFIVIFTSDQRRRTLRRLPYALLTGREKRSCSKAASASPQILSWPARIPQGPNYQSRSPSAFWIGFPHPARRAGAAPLIPPIRQRWHQSASTPRRQCARRQSNASSSGATRGTAAARRPESATTNSLKLLDNTFLFNVVDDPMERANLKERHRGHLRPPGH